MLFLYIECALEDEVFEDGAETQLECNKCVCACGNWVCTALTCNGESQQEHIVWKFFTHTGGWKWFGLFRCDSKGAGFVFIFSGEHQVTEDAQEGGEEEEMTEEEWRKRVAELNALQVDSSLKNLIY